MEILLDTSGAGIIQQALFENRTAATIALRRSLNKVAAKSRTAIIRRTGQELALPQKKIRKRVSIRRASGRNMEAGVTVSREPVRLNEYRPNKIKTGVSIRVKKNEGRKVLKYAFIAAMNDGKVGVYQRQNRSPRLPIRELFGPAVIEVAQDHIDDIAREAQEHLLTTFQHEFEWARRNS